MVSSAHFSDLGPVTSAHFLGRKNEGIKIVRMDAAAGHKSAQKEESPKGGATWEIFKLEKSGEL